MSLYVESFEAQDRERLFRFLALFARWECALKHNGFVRTGSYGQAEPNWKAFASQYEAEIASLAEQYFVGARSVLLANPPNREEVRGNKVEWCPNPRRRNETDAIYLLRVIRDVRNNLFHGGKFACFNLPELARDRELIDSATTILETAIDLNGQIGAMFEKPV